MDGQQAASEHGAGNPQKSARFAPWSRPELEEAQDGKGGHGQQDHLGFGWSWFIHSLPIIMCLFVTQGFDGIEACRFASWIETEEHSHTRGKRKCQNH